MGFLFYGLKIIRIDFIGYNYIINICLIVVECIFFLRFKDYILRLR